MLPYGKTAGNAVAAMSYLAEAWEPQRRVSTAEIAAARGLSRPLVGKLLVTLSQQGLLTGSPGPRGGYSLARNPSEITLLEVVTPFERLDRPVNCPFGPHWCGNHEPCPLHDEMVRLTEESRNFLSRTRLDIFAKRCEKKAATEAPHA
jgi:Rrf2 family protein